MTPCELYRCVDRSGHRRSTKLMKLRQLMKLSENCSLKQSLKDEEVSDSTLAFYVGIPLKLQILEQ